MRKARTNYPVFSVLVNVYNGGRFLSQAIESVINQTFGSFELLIWDNASDDDTYEICKKYQTSDNRVRYYLAQQHTSLYQARNLLLKKARGDYVAFLDADDVWLQNKLEQAEIELKRTGYPVFYSNFLLMSEVTKIKRQAYFSDLAYGNVLEHLLDNYTVGISTLVVKRELINTLPGPFKDRYNILGDFDLVLRLASQASFCCSTQPLVIYRTHESNLSKAHDNSRESEIVYWSGDSMNLELFQKKQINRAIMSLRLDWLLAEDRNLGQKWITFLKYFLEYGSLDWAWAKFSWMIQSLFSKFKLKINRQLRSLV